MARFVTLTFAVVAVAWTAASSYASRQSLPYLYQQPLPRPLTEVLSSNMLLQMADLVGGRPAAIPPTLDQNGHRYPYNQRAAHQVIAMTDGQQVDGAKGKDVGKATTTTNNKNTACARAIIVCCKPNTDKVNYGCFEAFGCPGFFIEINPCSKAIVGTLTH